MNNQEYIIINKTAIQKRIEELEKQFKGQVGYNMALGEIEFLKQILSQSTPLIPEIEKAYNWGYTDCEDGCEQDSNDCISNLKLDI